MSDKVGEDNIRLAELGLMTATLSHELRQPLFAIKSLTQLLGSRLNGEAEDLTGELLRQVSYLEVLVEGVGRYSRRSTGVQEPVHTGALLDEVNTLMGHRARRRRVELRVSSSVQVAAACDPTAMLQVLVNLVNNAIDASPGGSVVELRDRMDEQGGIVVEVQDQGGGIPEGLREQVFEPFFTTKAPGEGTGLGLAISRRLAEASGGLLEIPESEGGALLRLRLRPWS